MAVDGELCASIHRAVDRPKFDSDGMSDRKVHHALLVDVDSLADKVVIVTREMSEFAHEVGDESMRDFWAAR